MCIKRSEVELGSLKLDWQIAFTASSFKSDGNEISASDNSEWAEHTKSSGYFLNAKDECKANGEATEPNDVKCTASGSTALVQDANIQTLKDKLVKCGGGNGHSAYLTKWVIFDDERTQTTEELKFCNTLSNFTEFC